MIPTADATSKYRAVRQTLADREFNDEEIETTRASHTEANTSDFSEDVAESIEEIAAEQGSGDSTVVLENYLSDERARQLVDLVEYKADAEGIVVEYVDPKNTSRRCPECGHTSEGNRVSQAEFECERCGATANADSVGAKNVGWRYVRRGLQSSRRTGDSRLALKSGTVTPNRGFVPSD